MNPIHTPTNAINAVAHSDPYPYYATLLAGPRLAFDEELRLWVAGRAAVVAEVLSNPHCRVRPAAEPVPNALVGSAAGEIFGHLARMNDGRETHERPKMTLRRALGAVDLNAVHERAREIAATLAATHDVHRTGALSSWMFELPTFVVADLIGCGAAELPQVAAWTAHFVACLSPLSTPGHTALSNDAARALLHSFRVLMRATPTPRGSLLDRVKQEAAAVGWDNAPALLANLVGLLSQTYEATAGLIGNSIVALVTQPDLQEAMRAAPQRVASMVQEVGRFDPPVQNTRRFVAHSTSVAGVELPAGETILLVLAAANRDPAANVRPDEFLLDRAHRRTFGFGYGAHECPGQALACTIATAAIQELLRLSSSQQMGRWTWTYRPSVNGRIPLFTNPAGTTRG